MELALAHRCIYEYCRYYIANWTPGIRVSVWPTRIAARRQQELLCVIAMQELEWHTNEDDSRNAADVHEEAGTPVLEDLSSIWVEDDETANTIPTSSSV